MRQNLTVLMAGRGLGKTSMIGPFTYTMAATMPRAKTFFASTTYNQLMTKTLPVVQKMWDNHGLKEYIPGHQMGHYIIGKKPPKNWAKPYEVPRKYTNVITFFNGYTIELLSMDRPDLARGGSYDGGDIDEAALVSKDTIDKILIPSIRGRLRQFGHIDLHGQLRMYTTVPWQSDGAYIFDYEEKAKAMPDKYGFLEASTLDNVDIIGEDRIEFMRQEMDPLTFAVECENRRFAKTKDPFYNAFDDAYHIYKPKYIYQEGESGIQAVGTQAINDSAGFDLSFDFSGWFKCLTVWQSRANVGYCIDALHVYEDKNIDALVRKFCHKYRKTKVKHANIYGEFHGLDKRAEGETLFERVARILAAEGWSSELYVHEPALSHESRYEAVNEFFSETNDALPQIRFNVENCKPVLIALNSAKLDYKMRKDKKDEKNRSFNQAHATHYTDTVDYYLIQKYGHRLDLMDHYIGGSMRAGVA